MPTKIQARMIKLLELIEKHGANLGPPHTEAMGDGIGLTQEEIAFRMGTQWKYLNTGKEHR